MCLSFDLLNNFVLIGNNKPEKLISGLLFVVSVEHTFGGHLTLTEFPETLVTTPIIDLRITGKHTAIPKWLRRPATHEELARLTYDERLDQDETPSLDLRRDA